MNGYADIPGPDLKLRSCGFDNLISRMAHTRLTPNVKLTGRGPESRKTKPYYNRAPVERRVRFRASEHHGVP
jgi:hypothetical protein